VKIDIPGADPLDIRNVLLDFNGTLAQGGEISEPTRRLLEELSQSAKLYVATADTRGNAASECAGLPVELLALPGDMHEDEAKLQLLKELGPEHTVVFGNGRNDAMTLAQAVLGVCILGEEGAHKMAVASARIMMQSIEDGLKLLAEPERLIAAIRN
jgi:soluble P-type ATPase